MEMKKVPTQSDLPKVYNSSIQITGFITTLSPRKPGVENKLPCTSFFV